MSDFYLHEGNRYIVKSQKIMKIGLGAIFATIGIWSLIYNEYSQRGIIVCVLFCIFAGLMFASLTTKMVFDLDKRVFYVQNGSRKPRFTQPLSNYTGLELIRLSRFFGLLRNSILNVTFEDGGKTVKMAIRQFGPGNRAPQAMIEETEAFLGIRTQEAHDVKAPGEAPPGAGRLVYRPWSLKSPLVVFIIGAALLAGTFIWAQVNDMTLITLTVPLLCGVAVTAYGLFYLWKNGETLIFDAASGRVVRKLALLPEKELCRFSEIHAISTVGEMRVFEYVLTRKSENGGGDITISDSFASNKIKADRQAFEAHILPVIASMLALKAP
jgi:hypothetical protein